MPFAQRLRTHRVLVAVVVVGTGALACKDTTTPKTLSTAEISQPRFTASSGFVGTPIARGNVGAYHVQSKVNGFDVELKSHDNADIAVNSIAIAPHGHSGWHFHPGPVLVIVKAGAVTFYHGSDRTCTGTRYPVGSAFIEKGGDVGIARNEEDVETTVVATFFVAAGSPITRIDAPAPGNCSF